MENPKPLEQLLEALGLDLEGLAHQNCQVEKNIAEFRAKISNLPAVDDEEGVIEWVVDTIRGAGKDIAKKAEREELKLKLRMLEKPDDINLGDEEHKHTVLHIEETQISIEYARREGEVLTAFADIMERRKEDN